MDNDIEQQKEKHPDRFPAYHREGEGKKEREKERGLDCGIKSNEIRIKELELKEYPLGYPGDVGDQTAQCYPLQFRLFKQQIA